MTDEPKPSPYTRAVLSKRGQIAAQLLAQAQFDEETVEYTIKEAVRVADLLLKELGE